MARDLNRPGPQNLDLSGDVEDISMGRMNRFGSGSTRDDFYDYDHRFRTFKNDPRNHESCVERRAGQRRDIVELAGMPRRTADTDRRLAHPALDHLRRPRRPRAGPRPFGSAAGRISNMA